MWDKPSLLVVTSAACVLNAWLHRMWHSRVWRTLFGTGLLASACVVALQLLNAKPENVERESETVAQSGRKGAVTIATNMAGRGTDILLGGNSEYMARLKLRESLLPQVGHADSFAKGMTSSP